MSTNPNLPSGSIPSNLSEATFRTYEPHLTRAVLAFPKETCFAPPFLDAKGLPLSGNTFAARMRDSVVSLKRFQWETTVDTAKLWAISGKFAIAFDKDGCIWFRAKGQQGRPSHLMPEARVRNPNIDVTLTAGTWKGWTLDEVSAVILLIHNQRLSGPVILEGRVDETAVNAYETVYNIALVYDEERNVTVIT